MKEIIAIIRMNMINKTKEALLSEGFSSLHCSKVMGRGKKKVDLSFIDDLRRPEDLLMASFPGELIENFRLLPKRMVTVIVKDEDKEKVIKTLIDVNMTGNPGDGKIFVLDVPGILRIRTGEENEAAL